MCWSNWLRQWFYRQFPLILVAPIYVPCFFCRVIGSYVYSHGLSMVNFLFPRLRLATLESEKEEILHEVRQLRKMGQTGDLPRDLVRHWQSLCVSSFLDLSSSQFTMSRTCDMCGVDSWIIGFSPFYSVPNAEPSTCARNELNFGLVFEKLHRKLTLWLPRILICFLPLFKENDEVLEKLRNYDRMMADDVELR